MQEWTEWINQWIDRLIEFSGFEGHLLLLVTAPLTIIQGIFSLFPFATMLIVHVSALGAAEGLLFTWLFGSLASFAAFFAFRYLFRDWFQRRLAVKLAKYGGWQRYMDLYGGWVVILMRSIPIMPNNVISFMAAISPIKLRSYLWTSTVGTLSNVWQLGLIGSTLADLDSELAAAWMYYFAFCAVLVILFLLRVYRHR